MIELDMSNVWGEISLPQLLEVEQEVFAAHKTLAEGRGPGNDFIGWLDLPVMEDTAEMTRIKQAAERIRSDSDVLVVIGIGGSYLGARAAVEFVRSARYNALPKEGTPEILFAGCDLSPSTIAETLALLEGKRGCLNVISKSGTTTEPAVAFRIFRELLIKKYGEEGSKSRIFATTDKARGALKQFSDEMGYETFVVPDDVGGRYSVLTAVGLLPIAVAGIDLDALMSGAADAREKYLSSDFDTNDCMKYAAIRNALYRKGKVTEILVSYEPAAQLFCEWWKQLYGESEGKDNKGLYPSSFIFSTDLHSLGQYIQQGLRNIFETVVDIQESNASVVVPFDPQNIDGLNYLAGRELHEVNRTAMQATLFAHTDGDVPNVVLKVKDRSAYSFGYMVYFFELACGLSGYTLGVNPFNQPGVEAYKKNMFALLGKPGYEEQKAALDARMN